MTAFGPLPTFVDSAANGRSEPTLPKFGNAANDGYLGVAKTFSYRFGLALTRSISDKLHRFHT
jgi:hypothetical protein